MRLDDDVISAVPRHIAKRYRVVPVYRHGTSLAVAISDPSDLDTIDSLHHSAEQLKSSVSVATRRRTSKPRSTNITARADDSVGEDDPGHHRG